MTTTEHRIVAGPRDCLSCICGFLQVGAHAHDTEKEALTRHLLDVGRESAKGELVTLDDPRVKVGARLRLEFDAPADFATEGTADDGTADDAFRDLRVAARYASRASRIYLLAEASDPDRDMREALQAALEDYTLPRGTRWPADDLGDLVALLRSRDYDIVRKGDPA